MTLLNQPSANQFAEPQITTPVLNNLQLLVVEDEPHERAVMVSALEACGADVVAVGSAQAGLEAVKQQRPDVLISDLFLPDSDGYTLMSRVKALITHQCLSQVPAIAVSASAKEVNLDRALFVGFKRYVSKPILPARLVALVARLAEREAG